MEQYFGLGKGSETSVTSHNLAKLGQLIEGGIAGALPSSHSGNIFLRRLFNVLFSKLPFAGSWNSGYYPKMPEPFPGPGWPAGLVAFLLAITASHIFEFLDSHLSSTSTSSRTSNHWILKDMTASNIFRWSFQLHNIDVCVKYGSEPIFHPPGGIQHTSNLGPILQIGPSELVTSDIEALKRKCAVRSPYP
jgi:hypothetical protein